MGEIDGIVNSRQPDRETGKTGVRVMGNLLEERKVERGGDNESTKLTGRVEGCDLI